MHTTSDSSTTTRDRRAMYIECALPTYPIDPYAASIYHAMYDKQACHAIARSSTRTKILHTLHILNETLTFIITSSNVIFIAFGTFNK